MGSKQAKPAIEWVKIAVDVIMSADTFVGVGARLRARPGNSAAPSSLLTGLVKCGCCGAGRTLATGKGGRYRYYKCNTRIGKGIWPIARTATCPWRSWRSGATIPANKVFTPSRVQAMGLQRDIKAGRTSQDETLKTLTKELDQVSTTTDRLYQAVEQGVLELNDSLKTRSHKLQARRQAIFTEMAGLPDARGPAKGAIAPQAYRSLYPIPEDQTVNPTWICEGVSAALGR